MAANNKKFVNRLYQEYHMKLHGYLTKRLRGLAFDASDVAQETYLRMLRVKNTEGIDNPHAYIFRVATHVIREFHLKEQTQGNLTDLLSKDSRTSKSAESADLQVERILGLENLNVTITSMPPTYRAVLILRKRDGMSYKEISDALSISKHTVKKYLTRAVAWCREDHKKRKPGGAG